MLSSLAICATLGASYVLGAILYRIAPEEVDPFLLKHKSLKTMAKYIRYQAAVLGIIFGFVLAKNQELIATFSVLIFLYALITTSIAVNKKPLEKAVKFASIPTAIFTISAWVVGLVL